MRGASRPPHPSRPAPEVAASIRPPLLAAAATLTLPAAKADAAIVFGSAPSGEGHDRADLKLAGNADEVIAAIGAAQRRTIVVLSVRSA